MPSLYDFLQKADAIEELASAIYQAAARRFESDARWSGLFRRLADEEKQHALRIRMLGARLGRDRKSLREARLAEVDLDSLRQDGETLLNRIASPRRLDLADALELVVGLERGLASVHAEVVVVTRDPEFSRFFQDLADADRAHAEMLAWRREPPSE